MNDDPREHICDIARLAYDRRLLDSAGGNVSVRQGERIYATPRYSGSKFQWRLKPDQINVLDISGDLIEARGELSREFPMHISIYREFPDAGAVIPAHARNVQVFAHLRMPI